MPRLKSEINPTLIHLLRKEASLSQEEFASKLKVSMNTVQKWEQGRATPQPKNLRSLLKLSEKYLGLGIDRLLKKTDKSNLN